MRPTKSRTPPAKIHMNDHLLPSGSAGARNAFRDGAPQCVAVVRRSFMPRSIHRLTASTLEADPNGGNTTEGHAASPDLRLNDIALVLSCRLPTAPGGARPPRPVRRPRDALGRRADVDLPVATTTAPCSRPWGRCRASERLAMSCAMHCADHSPTTASLLFWPPAMVTKRA